MRLLIYIAREYEQYVNSKNYKLHGAKQYKFPAPEFFVISINKNGPDEMRLSDCFNGRSTALELVVPIIKESYGTSLASYLNFARDVKANYRKGMNLENIIRDCLERVDGDDRAAQLIRKEGVNMTSLFEKAFDYDEMVNDLKISYEQLAEEEAEKRALVNYIQGARDFGVADNQIRTKLLEKYSVQQIDEAFAKIDSDE